MIGRRLSHYKILEEISRGGMGIVYRAMDLNLDREVALKVLPPELVADSERKRRFVREAKAAATLEHPHIAVVHEVDESEGESFVVMELIQGEMLRDALERRRLPLARSLELAAEVAEGLSFAHEKGIIHRDIKPSNVMVTEQDHAKVIDFGLAKLLEPIGKEGSEVSTALREETDSGKVMGTVSYMSPEQARGEKVDHRSDIFGFGIVFYEMLTGGIPFHGKTGIETLNAILNTSTPKLGDLGSEVPAEESYSLQHIVNKCLEKEPTERYQTIQDAVIDLRSARRRLESGAVSPVVSRPKAKLGLFAAVAGLIALFVIGWSLLRPQTPPQEDTPVATSSNPSIAVFFFDNINEDSDLEWLSLGLAEMLVTDLSQSPQIDVVSTNQLYQILRKMNKLDERITSLDVIQEVADRANVETVLLGSFMKAGESIRINIRVQEARTGKILTTEKVEAEGESNLFARVDELTRRIRLDFEIPPGSGFQPIEELTTSSPEAYRYRIEAIKLFRQGKAEESIALYEKAIEVDPEFAEALNGLSTQHWNLGHYQRSEAYAKRILALGDRLPPNLRYRAEFRLYSLHQEDYGRAIEAEKKRLTLRKMVPNDLANRYRFLERDAEAIEMLEDFRREGGNFRSAFNYSNLSRCYIVLGEFDKAYQVLMEGLSRYPDSPVIHASLGHVYLFWHRLEEALETFERADFTNQRRWMVFVLRDQFREAALESQKVAEFTDIVQKSRGLGCKAFTQLYMGNAQEARSLLEQAGDVFIEPDQRSATTLAAAGNVLLETGRLEEATAKAKDAQRDGKGNIPEWEGLFLEAVALARLGRMDDAVQVAESLKQRTEPIPTEKEKRRYHHIMGEVALARGQHSHAVEELEKAAGMLQTHGGGSIYVVFPYRIGNAPQVPIWYSMASACLANGDEEQAAEWFRRITEATVDRIVWPIPYVRSFYFLGKIHENRGEMDSAREYYRRFYEYWKDGDMDRERVEEAKKKSM